MTVQAIHPVAYRYELATVKVGDTYTSFGPPQLGFAKPNVPEGAMRNLTPLYQVSATDLPPLVLAIRRHLEWFERFICDRDELDSSTPRKVAQNAQDAALLLRQALGDVTTPAEEG